VWGCDSCGDDISIHVSGEGVGEIFHEDGIIEIPAVENGIDDGVGGGMGFEKPRTAIDSDGFGGGRFRKPDPAGTRGDANAFDVGEFEDAVAGIMIVGESDAVAMVQVGVGGGFRGGGGSTGNVRLEQAIRAKVSQRR